MVIRLMFKWGTCVNNVHFAFWRWVTCRLLLYGREMQRPVWSGAGGLLCCETGFVFGAELADLGFNRGTRKTVKDAVCGDRQFVMERCFPAEVLYCQRCV